jgi:hypothetical protein
VKNNPINKKDPKGLYGDNPDWCDFMPCYDARPTRLESEWFAMIGQTECMAKCVLEQLVHEAIVEAAALAVEEAAKLAINQAAAGLIKKGTWVAMIVGGVKKIRCIVNCSCPRN